MPIGLIVLTLGMANPQDKPAPAPPAGAQPTTPPGATAVGGVTVSGTRAQVETAIDRRSYSVANDLVATTGSIGDVLRNIPSVQVDLQGNLSLRGDANVTVLVDGKPSSQFSGESLAQTLQSVPASQIDRIEVITNPSAEFRADGSGGIINLVMKKAKGAGKTASLRVQAATGARGLVSGNAGYNSDRLSTVADFSAQLDHQVQITDNLQSLPDNNSDFNRGHLTQSVLNAHLGSDYDLSAKTRLSASLRLAYFHGGLRSIDQFEQDNAAGVPISGFTRFSGQHGTQYNDDASVILRHTWAEGRDLVLNATYDGMQYKRDRLDLITPTLPPGSDTTAAFERHTHNNRAVFTADYETPMPGKARLKLGYDFQYTDTLFEHAGAISQTGSFSDVETQNQAYATYERPFGKLDTLIGLRADSLHLALDQQAPNAPAPRTYDQLYPSLHLSYGLTEGRKLTASYSRRVDRPSYGQLDPIPYPQGSGTVTEGNANLKPQDTDSFELGFEARKDRSSLLATLYYRQTANAFSSLFTIQPDGGLLQQSQNVGSQRNGGLELVLANRLTPKITYNLSADAYWSQLAAPNLGFPQTRQAVAGFGRANLNWQLTPKDFLQFNVFMNGRSLLPQGYVKPFMSGNIGFRHTVSSKLSWMFVVQDPFDTAKSREVLDSFGGKDRQFSTNNNRMASLTLVWNFSGKPPATDFDFKAGGYGAAAAP